MVYSCDVLAEFSAAITQVFSVTSIFIYCSKPYSYADLVLNNIFFGNGDMPTFFL